MTADFVSRMIGTVIFALIGARLGVDASPAVGLPADITATEWIDAVYSSPLETRFSILTNCKVKISPVKHR